MKKIAACVLLFAHALAHSADQGKEEPAWMKKERAEIREIRQRSFDKSLVGKIAMVSGTVDQQRMVISRDDIITALYVDLPCRVNLRNASKLLRAEITYGKNLTEACWGFVPGVTSDEIAIISRYGDVHPDSLLSYFHGFIQSDGAVTVEGRAMDMNQPRKEIEEYHKSLR